MTNQDRIRVTFSSKLVLKIVFIQPPNPIVRPLDHSNPLMFFQRESHVVPPAIGPKTGLGTHWLRSAKARIEPRSPYTLGVHVVNLGTQFLLRQIGSVPPPTVDR